MSVVELSAKALAICEKHWMPEKTRCQKCPIHNACTAHMSQWSHAGLNEHTARVNAAAEQVMP